MHVPRRLNHCWVFHSGHCPLPSQSHQLEHHGHPISCVTQSHDVKHPNMNTAQTITPCRERPLKQTTMINGDSTMRTTHHDANSFFKFLSLPLEQMKFVSSWISQKTIWQQNSIGLCSLSSFKFIKFLHRP